MILNSILHILNFKLQKHNWLDEKLGLDPTCNWKVKKSTMRFNTNQVNFSVTITCKNSYLHQITVLSRLTFSSPMCLIVTEKNNGMPTTVTLCCPNPHKPKFLFCILVCSSDISRYGKQVLKVLCPFYNSGLFLRKVL